MAKRVDSSNTPSAPASTEANDLAVLHPERQIQIRGRTITVREYGFAEGIELAPLVAPFVAALNDAMSRSDAMPNIGDVEQALSGHWDSVRQLIAIACDVEPAWLDALTDTEGDVLMMVWWEVNSRFFIRRVVSQMTAEKIRNRLAGHVSTPPSSVPGTDAHPPTSDDLPADS